MFSSQTLWIFVFISISVQMEMVSSGDFACPEGEFICGNLTKCVEQKYHCDNIDHCGNNADEQNCYNLDGWIKGSDNLLKVKPDPEECKLTDYPRECNCTKDERLVCSHKNLTYIPEGIPPDTSHLILMNNLIRDIPVTAFQGLYNLEVLYLSENLLEELPSGIFQDLNNLGWLFLNDNKIKKLENGTFRGLDQLFWLRLANNQLTDMMITERFRELYSLTWCDLGYNKLSRIRTNTFAGDFDLHVLELNNNQISVIEAGALIGQNNLTVLNLTWNNLTTLPKDLLKNLPELKTLVLSNNPLIIDEDIFADAPALIELDLSGINIPNISHNMFNKLTELEIMHFSRFEYCKFVPHVRNCIPKTDGISSSENLLEGTILRVSVWTIALLTTCGNLNVFISRLLIHSENKVHSIVVSNLCAADFLMGLYLLVIGIQDVRFRNSYISYALEWSESWGCHFAGFLALLSTEASVLTLTFISLERFFIVAFPYRFHRLNIKEVSTVLVLVWILALSLAAAPLIFTSYFQNFYGINGVCFPLHIHDPMLDGWEYSIFIFLGINSFSFVVIIISYCGMFQSIQMTRRRTTTFMQGDVSYAKRFFFIVLTDCVCWLPLAVVKLVALSNHEIPKSLYAWIVIFILPVNSALNPILYTLSTHPFKRLLKQRLQKRTSNSVNGFASKCERTILSTDPAGESIKLQ